MAGLGSVAQQDLSDFEMEVRAHEATGRNRGRTSGGTTAARVVERKEAERERRQHMKALCAKLASLIPKEHFANPGHNWNSEMRGETD
ncbi:hypothetical protein TRIUR3_32669 [Triticum urartu]|uniref:BHLH domain-containing protein n=1 Tax=Triticum urartu TaxID=4572 RepID=M7YKD7_TRIUA|nr:hypothetical protein TRIUR3_32669 [Triticum urartu]